MPVTYVIADGADRAVLDNLINEFRPDLVEAEVNVAMVFAYNEKGGPAIKVRGQAKAGKCKINSLQDRVEGKADATITVDGKGWAGWNKNRRKALLHHELCHIEIAGMDRDTADRPVLDAKYGDWDFDGFDEIVERYGADSFESSNFHAVASRHAQLRLFPLDPAAPSEVTLDKKAIKKAVEAAGGEVVAARGTLFPPDPDGDGDEPAKPARKGGLARAKAAAKATQEPANGKAPKSPKVPKGPKAAKAKG